jgi:antibiotic biosynthesis monooxygenase (ABM) superfamily enzyme
MRATPAVASVSAARPWVIRLVTTLAAWLVAFLIVLALLLVFGQQLESLPPALNALVFTGVLVPIMGNLVMPFIGAVFDRWVAGRTVYRRRRQRSDRPSWLREW